VQALAYKISQMQALVKSHFYEKLLCFAALRAALGLGFFFDSAHAITTALWAHPLDIRIVHTAKFVTTAEALEGYLLCHCSLQTTR